MSMDDQIKLMNGEFPHTTMWFGMIRGQWPVRSFSIEGHATSWLAEAKNGEQRYLWRAEVVNATRLELVPPVPAGLRDARGEQTERSSTHGPGWAELGGA